MAEEPGDPPRNGASERVDDAAERAAEPAPAPQALPGYAQNPPYQQQPPYVPPPYQQPHYGPPGYAPPYPPPYAYGYPYPYPYAPPQRPEKTNTLSIVSLVFGVLGLVFLYGIGPIVAVVTGHIARRQIKRSSDREGGGGMALAGIILGWVGLALFLFIVALIVWDITSGPDVDGYYFG